MLRFARAPDGAVCFDVRARAHGRGAWTCASSTCVTRAVQKEAFARAFDEPVVVAHPALLDAVVATMAAEVRAGLGLVRRAGGLAAGREEVARVIGQGVGGRGVVALVLAIDLSARTVADARRLVTQGPDDVDTTVAVVVGPAMAEVGVAIGRKPTGVLAVSGTPRARQLIVDLQRAEHLAQPDKRA